MKSSNTLELAYAPIHSLAMRVRNGELTSRALVDCYLQRIAQHDEKYHAFVEVYADEARAAAETADRELKGGKARGPLHGIPIALKDLIDHLAARFIDVAVAQGVREQPERVQRLT